MSKKKSNTKIVVSGILMIGFISLAVMILPIMFSSVDESGSVSADYQDQHDSGTDMIKLSLTALSFVGVLIAIAVIIAVVKKIKW